MVTIIAALTPTWQRAIARAAQHVAHGCKAERIACKTYRVDSSKGDGSTYTVVVGSVQQLQATCTCPAGQQGKVCWHQWLGIELAAARIAQCEKERAQVAPQAAPAQDAVSKMGRFKNRWPSQSAA